MESVDDVFNKKYDEFGRDLLGACPELAESSNAARALSSEQRRTQFKAEVLSSCSPSRNATLAPSYVLPGVKMPQGVWELLSNKSKKAIQEYLTVLSFTYLLESGTSDDISGNAWSSSWAHKMFDEMKSKMKNVDFDGISEKIKNLFGSAGAGGIGGIPQIPEKFLKGQIAKLAEEIVKEFRVEDFGLDPAAMEGGDPTKALNMIMELFMKNPQSFQNVIQKVGKKLQQKIQSGSLRPQELVAEAEELMKTFSENPQFVEMMESFRHAFSFEDPTVARATGNAHSNRLSIVKQRLRKKLEAKNAGKR